MDDHTLYCLTGDSPELFDGVHRGVRTVEDALLDRIDELKKALDATEDRATEAEKGLYRVFTSIADKEDAERLVALFSLYRESVERGTGMVDPHRVMRVLADRLTKVVEAHKEA